MDNIIDRLKKLKKKKEIDSSPLDDLFETEKETENGVDEKTDSGLEIKPFGRSSREEPPEKETTQTPERISGTIPSKGIRELSFDEIEDSGEIEPSKKETKTEKIIIELSSRDPQKAKYIKLIVALLEAGQYKAARQEINKFENT
jgi:hypothetical protein